MILDAPTREAYDLVVIGSGPAGLTTAKVYAEIAPHARLLIVESGAPQVLHLAAGLSKVVASGDLASDYYPTHAQRALGGTSTVWTGLCTEMERRPFLAGQWPIKYEDMASHYQEAASILDLPSDVYEKPSALLPGSTHLLYKPYYRRVTRFAEKYRAWLEASQQVDLLPGYTTVGFDVGERLIESVKVESTGRSAPVSNSLIAKRVVIACGGLGNPRLLLLSDIGAKTPVGRYFMEHPHVYRACTLAVDREALLQVSGAPERGRIDAFQLTSEFCVEHGLLSSTFQFMKGVAERLEMLRGRRRVTRFGQVILRAEMKASPANRVTLSSDRKDRLGQPLAAVRLRFDRDQIRREFDQFSRALVRSGLGRTSELPKKMAVTGGGHLMGTTRMGSSPAESVVDSDCKIWELDNAYVAGSSVFPAGGSANPTISLVALAIRLGRHLAATA